MVDVCLALKGRVVEQEAATELMVPSAGDPETRMNHENIWNARIFQDKASAKVCRPQSLNAQVLWRQRLGTCLTLRRPLTSMKAARRARWNSVFVHPHPRHDAAGNVR